MKVISMIVLALIIISTQTQVANAKDYSKYRDGTYVLINIHNEYVGPKHIFNRQFFEVANGYLVGSIRFILAHKANGAPINLVKQNINIDTNGFDNDNSWMIVYIERILQTYVNILYSANTPNLDLNFDLYVRTLEKNISENFMRGAKKYLKDEWDSAVYGENEEYGD